MTNTTQTRPATAARSPFARVFDVRIIRTKSPDPAWMLGTSNTTVLNRSRAEKGLVRRTKIPQRQETRAGLSSPNFNVNRRAKARRFYGAARSGYSLFIPPRPIKDKAAASSNPRPRA